MKTKGSKTIFTTVLMLFMVLAVSIGVWLFVAAPIASAQADAIEAEEPTDLTFLLNEDEQSYTVRILDKTITTVTIPSTYNNLPVTAIADSGFTGCTALEKVIIPSSVKYIGNNAFMRCTNLKRVLGMSGVVSYGNNAFSMCSSLEYLILPSGLTNVGTTMLRSVKATVYSRTAEEDLLQLNSSCLTSFSGNIVYGNELVYNEYVDPITGETGLSLASWQNLDLYPNGFDDDTQVIVMSWHSDVTLTNGTKTDGKVLNIEQWAFADCNADSVIIKNTDGYTHSINIESYAFGQCRVKNVSIETDITLNDPVDGDSMAIFYDSADLQTVGLPSIDTIPYQMFMDCKALSEINFNDMDESNHLSNTVAKIEGQAFYSCYSMPELFISENIEFIGQQAFYLWGGNTSVYQNIYINLEQPAEDWNPAWDSGIDFNNCNVEFVAVAELNVQFVVDQEGVINPVGQQRMVVSRNATLNDLGLNDPISQSHNFNGAWYTTESRDAGTEFDGDRQIKTDLILYAGWEIKMFDVVFPQVNCCSFYDFNDNNNDCIDSQILQCAYGDIYSFYIDINDGYKEVKIFSNGNLLEPVSGEVYRLVITDSILISVTYELYEYSITYENVLKGTNPNAGITKYTVESETIRFEYPYWEAYKSAHWNIPYIQKGSTGNKIIKAIWENPREFTITFTMDDDPNATNPNGAYIKYTVEDNVSLLDPVSPGRESGAWKTKKDVIISGWTAYEYWEDMTLNVKWGTGKKYQVSFDLNGGSGNSSTILATYGELLPSKAMPTLRKFRFLGYYSINNNQQYYSSNMTPQKWYQLKNDTLKANWEQVLFTITLEQRGGTGIGGDTYIELRYGQEWPVIEMPTRRGYSIDGYYYMYDIENRKIYNADGTYNPNNIVFPGYFNLRQDITLRCNWKLEDVYSFIIEKLHAMDDSATHIETKRLSIEGYFSFTADERMMWTEYTQDMQSIVRRESRAFTRWVMNINGPQDYNPQTNPWYVISTNREISINVYDLLEKYYPNRDVAAPNNIHIRAIYNDDAQNETFGSCITEGTLITLSNGKQVPVEQLKGDEKLLVWNLYTGQFDTAPILVIDHDPARIYEIVNLYFSDGTAVKVISEHGFWNCTLNKYVYLDNNAGQYIGHWFNKQIVDENGQISWTKVQLTDVVLSEEFTTAWSPVTYGHLCYYVNGMLSMPGGINGLFNIFDVSEDMKYDTAEFEKDIETYGLFTYEEISELVFVPEEIFNAVNGQYLKVAIGKGLITIDGIQELINRYIALFA